MLADLYLKAGVNARPKLIKSNVIVPDQLHIGCTYYLKDRSLLCKVKHLMFNSDDSKARVLLEHEDRTDAWHLDDLVN